MNKLDRLKKKTVNGTKAALRAAKHAALTGEFSVSQKEYNDRVAICESCPLYEEHKEDECGECLCYIKILKAKMVSEYCPLLKWPGDEFKIEYPTEEE